MTTATQTVPEMVIDITGRRYGGAYYHDAEYRLTVTRHENGHVTLDLQDEMDNQVAFQNLDPSQARAVHDVLKQERTDAVPGIDGLRVQPTWVLGDDQQYVEITDILDEVCEWLRYGIGLQEWAGGDEWAY